MSHYLKVLMDSLFANTGGQFVNEIVWGYAPSGAPPRHGFHRKHDTLFYYSKGRRPAFTHQFTEMSERTRATYKHRG